MKSLFRWLLGAAVLAAWVATSVPLQATPWTPIHWQNQGRWRNWVRDRNNNFVDDEIEKKKPQSMVNIIVDLNRCPGDPVSGNLVNYLRSKSDSKQVYVGKYLSFVAVKAVKVKDCYDIAQRPEVAMVELDLPMKWCDTDRQTMKVEDSDPAKGGYADNLSKLPAPWTWPTAPNGKGLNGEGVSIAILDSAIDTTIDELKGACQHGYDTFHDTPGDDVIPKLDVVKDSKGNNLFTVGQQHGTWMARFALGRPASTGDFGIAPKAGLVSVKVLKAVLGTSGGKEYVQPFGGNHELMEGLEWVIEHAQALNIRVVNISSNVTFTAPPGEPPFKNDGLDSLSQAVNRVVAAGIVVVTTAGNLSQGDTVIKPPGTASWAITVAAADHNGQVDRTKAVPGDSVSGPLSVEVPQPLDNMKPEITAPSQFGTSRAAARISGLLALLLQMDPNLNPGSLKDLLIRTAEPRGTPTTNPKLTKQPYPDPKKVTWNEQWGFGYVDAFKAANALYQPRTADLTFKPFDNDPDPFPNPIQIQRQDPANPQNWINTEVVKPEAQHKINVRIWNKKGNPVDNVRVNFAFYWFTAGNTIKDNWNSPQWYSIASYCIPSSLAAGATPQDVSVPWTAPKIPPELGIDPAHGCVHVSIDYGFDMDYSNNFAQHNVQVSNVLPGSAPTARFAFRLENPLPGEADITLNVDNRHPDWKVDLKQTTFKMKPHTCAQIVKATVTPPPGVKPGTEAWFFITPVATPIPPGDRPTPVKPKRVELSGVILKAVVPAPGPVKPGGPDDLLPRPHGRGGLFGRVLALDAHGGYLGTVAGATLVFKGSGKGAQVTSDKEGLYHADLDPGTYSDAVQAPGYKPGESPGAPLKVTEGYLDYNFALIKEDGAGPTPPHAGTLSGTVSERTAEGKLVGIPGATIKLERDKARPPVSETATSHQAGHYEVTLPAGAWRASVSAPGFGTLADPQLIEVAEGQKVTRDFVLHREKVPRTELTFTVTVYEQVRGEKRPLAGAVVTLHKAGQALESAPRVVTDAQGKAVFKGKDVSEGAHDVLVRHDKFKPQELKQVEIKGGGAHEKEFTLTAGEPAPEVKVPKLVGHTEEDARALLKEAGLAVGTVARKEETTKERSQDKHTEVTRQSVSAGSMVPKGTAIDLFVIRYVYKR
jgi:hypothetical protein